MAYPRSRRRRPSRRTRSPRTGPIFAGVLISIGLLGWLSSRPALLVGFLLALAGCGLASAGLYLAWTRSTRRRAQALTRSIAVADRLNGPQFEQWVATLMRRTGFTHVEVRGGAGDLGADITAVAPDGRRLVVQCKRHQARRPVGSPDVQKLAGTAWTVHEANLAAIITTSGFTKPAEAVAAQLRIGLVGRDSLARWATDGLQPVALINPGGALPLGRPAGRRPPP